ncbi:uncharacterized protein EDB91DRAFT_1081640 [Suillus paluster]|uniref:uncharacterized protein n=1 Tax=Suillus paluster TaxID=48578 RepID=UPI001B864098|nr:uncharacterized protein EDB91DRAFT_1081640 [Suillus paluster]KAG1741845.1 hypothetical protein EDB91DRAFT_1081640 [Suillus paluster]
MEVIMHQRRKLTRTTSLKRDTTDAHATDVAFVAIVIGSSVPVLATLQCWVIEEMIWGYLVLCTRQLGNYVAFSICLRFTFMKTLHCTPTAYRHVRTVLILGNVRKGTIISLVSLANRDVHRLLDQVSMSDAFVIHITGPTYPADW